MLLARLSASMSTMFVMPLHASSSQGCFSVGHCQTQVIAKFGLEFGSFRCGGDSTINRHGHVKRAPKAIIAHTHAPHLWHKTRPVRNPV